MNGTNSNTNDNTSSNIIDKESLPIEAITPQRRVPKYSIGRTTFGEKVVNKIKELRTKYGLNIYNIRCELERYYYGNNSNSSNRNINT